MLQNRAPTSQRRLTGSASPNASSSDHSHLSAGGVAGGGGNPGGGCEPSRRSKRQSKPSRYMQEQFDLEEDEELSDSVRSLGAAGAHGVRGGSDRVGSPRTGTAPPTAPGSHHTSHYHQQEQQAPASAAQLHRSTSQRMDLFPPHPPTQHLDMHTMDDPLSTFMELMFQVRSRKRKQEA